ncbi:unnamed protein product [Sphagnum balticum]
MNPKLSSNSVAEYDLPSLDGFKIKPSLDELRRMTKEELKRVKGVSIRGREGQLGLSTEVVEAALRGKDEGFQSGKHSHRG